MGKTNNLIWLRKGSCAYHLGISWKTGRAGLRKRLYLHAWGQGALWGKCERKHYHVCCLLSWSQQGLEDDKETSSVLRTSLKVCQAGREPHRPHQVITNFHCALYEPARQTTSLGNSCCCSLSAGTFHKNSFPAPNSVLTQTWHAELPLHPFIYCLVSFSVLDSLTRTPGWFQILSISIRVWWLN